MRNTLRKIWMAVCVMMTSSYAHAQASVVRSPAISESEAVVLRNLPEWEFTTRAYQEEAVRLMLKEVNKVAPLLPLNEQLPIREEDLVGRYVGLPSMVGLGWISTSNFSYTFDRKLCALSRRDMMARFYEAKEIYRWPMNRMDKKKAFEIASELMKNLNVDVAGLNHDFTVEITTPESEGVLRKHFFPHYWVNWRNKEGQAVAFIEFVEPTKYILQLRVRDSNYIKTEPIAIPDLAELLKQTNAPAKSADNLSGSATNNGAELRGK